MKFYYNKATKEKITEDEYKKLSPEDQKKCAIWKERGETSSTNRSPKRRRQDYEWYNVDDAISKAVANIPFNVFAGVQQALKYAIDTAETTVKEEIPGVMTANVVLTYGKSIGGTAAMNVAAKALYSFVRHMNSGRTNYDSTDLMVYVMAMSQIYAAICDAKRAYQLAMTYKYENKYIPKGIAAALKLDLDDISSNLANFRYNINLICAKVSALCIPEAFNIHKRHAFVMSNIFTDSDSLRGQFYAFRPVAWLQWSATADSNGSSLQSFPVSNTGGLRTATNIIADLNSLISELIYDEDANIMSGDILKAFGSDKIYNTSMLDENATVSFVFNEDVLSQFENSQTYYTVGNATNLFNGTGAYKITQSDLDLVTTEPEESPAEIHMTQVLFNSHKEDPTYQDVLEWSRMMCMNVSQLATYGTELLISYTMYTAEATFENLTTVFRINESGTAENELINRLCTLSNFDWHPIIYLFTKPEGATSFGYQAYIGDIKKAAIIDATKVRALNDAAIMGALNSLKFIANATRNQK